MNNEDAHTDSMIITFNTAVVETAGEILGKHREKKNTKNKKKQQLWVAAEILDLCDKRIQARKKRFEPEGSNIKRYMYLGKRKLDRRTV